MLSIQKVILLLPMAILAACSSAQQTKTEAPNKDEKKTTKSVKTSEVKQNAALTFRQKPKPLSKSARTEDWPTYLGVNSDGISNETKLLKNLNNNALKLIWEMKKGNGYSAPSVAGNKVFLFHRLKDKEQIECVEAETGNLFWQHSYKVNYSDRYGYSDGTRASPVIDGEHVYTFGVEGKLTCIAIDSGKVIWSRDLAKEMKAKLGFFGLSCTPLIEEKLIILNLGVKGGPCVVALDKLTGKKVWGAGDQWGASYSTPIAATIHGKRRVLVFAGGESKPPHGGLLCIDPANGKIDFRFPWRSKKFESVNVSCAVFFANKVFISTSYQTGGALLEIDSNFQPKVLWKNVEFGTHWNTAVYKDGYLYGIDGRHQQNAQLVCVDAKTGKSLWRKTLDWKEKIKLSNGEERELTAGVMRGHLLWADGHFLCLGEMGHLLWLDLTPDGCKILTKKRVFFASETWSPPVLSRGLLYLCQNSTDRLTKKAPRFLCFDLRGE